MTGDSAATVHGTCVAVGGRAVLITGPSGAGKSALALQMMGLGAELVADDRVALSRRGAVLVARAPAALAGLIEARGVGLLHAAARDEADIVLVADLGAAASPRLPERHGIVLLGCHVDLVAGPMQAHLPAALVLYLRGGRAA